MKDLEFKQVMGDLERQLENAAGVLQGKQLERFWSLIDGLNDKHRHTRPTYQQLSSALDEAIDSIQEVAIHTLMYCEATYELDEQARVNLEATVRELKGVLDGTNQQNREESKDSRSEEGS